MALAELGIAAELARREVEVLDRDLDDDRVGVLAGAIAGRDDLDRRLARRRRAFPARAVSQPLLRPPASISAGDERPRRRAPPTDCGPASASARRLRDQAYACTSRNLLRAMSASEFAYRVGAAARRPASWWQLLKFGIVGGSGYLINLGGLRHPGRRPRPALRARRGWCLLRRHQQQLPLEPPLDLCAPARAPPASRCRASSSSASARCALNLLVLELLISGDVVATSPHRRSRSRSRCRSTSSATSSGRLTADPCPSWTEGPGTPLTKAQEVTVAPQVRPAARRSLAEGRPVSHPRWCLAPWLALNR